MFTEDADFEETLHLVDSTSEYGLTGAVIAQDTYAIEKLKIHWLTVLVILCKR